MKLILITNPKSILNRYELGLKGLVFGSALIVCTAILLGFTAYYSAKSLSDPKVNQTIINKWNAQLKEDKISLSQLESDSEFKLRGLTVALAEAQARLIRLEALGERLVNKGSLNEGEFNFSNAVAVGGLKDLDETDAFEKPSFMSELEGLLGKLSDQETQMNVLASVLDDQLIEKEVFLAGKPIKKGWMSSFYGKRIDPFTGKLAQHKGVDFAGKENAEIIAVASGVVVWSGDRSGYGLVVEIDHGKGYKTRYAHNKTNIVASGDIVQKGQILARMGSTGRSTGPHTHFEVLRNDRQVNPEQYIFRNPR